MAFRVAVAALGDELAPAHFGKAERFGIYEVGAGEFRPVELRPNDPPCLGTGQHHEQRLAASVETVADCRYVMAASIGPAAELALARRDIRCLYVLSSIDAALEKLARSPLGQRP